MSDTQILREKYAVNKIWVLAAVATSMTLVPLNIVSAQEQGGASCATPGTAILANVPAKKDDLAPSLKREIAGYGRQAKASNCVIELVCVAMDRSDAARDIASKQCVVVRDQLVKSGFAKADIDTSRKNPGSGRTAGMVYFTAK